MPPRLVKNCNQFVYLPGRFDPHHRPWCTRLRHAHGLRVCRRHVVEAKARETSTMIFPILMSPCGDRLTLLGLDYSPSDRPDCHTNSFRFTFYLFSRKKNV